MTASGVGASFVGRTFGTLTAIEKVSSDKRWPGIFKFRCACDGKIIVRHGHSIMAMAGKGKVPSCGCTHGKHGYRPADHANSKFGRLTAIRQEPAGQPKMWLLRCDCGEEVVRNIKDTRDAVKDGYSPSCPQCRHKNSSPPQFIKTPAIQDTGDIF